MIIKSHDIKNYFTKNSIFLFYGENDGLKDEIISSTDNTSTDPCSFILTAFIYFLIININNIIRFIFASTIMGIIVFYLGQSLSYEPEITLFFPQLLIIILVAIVVYFGILILIDKETREMIKNASKLIPRN